MMKDLTIRPMLPQMARKDRGVPREMGLKETIQANKALIPWALQINHSSFNRNRLKRSKTTKSTHLCRWLSLQISSSKSSIGMLKTSIQEEVLIKSSKMIRWLVLDLELLLRISMGS
jgi:hypothetical protein